VPVVRFLVHLVVIAWCHFMVRLLGEAGTVKIVTNTSPKLSDKGVQCMMVGYVENHDADDY